MRRAIALLIALAAVIAFAGSVSAAAGASDVVSQSIVSADGTCQVSLELTLYLEEAVGNLEFPLPKNAKNVTVNGAVGKTRRSGESLNVDLSGMLGGFAGNFSLIIRYSLPDMITVSSDDENSEETKLTLMLPLLSGFAYPIERMHFEIRLPGEITGTPVFTSGYFQSSIESSMKIQTDGDVITGEISGALKDHETLSMELPVTPEMFPNKEKPKWNIRIDDIGMYLCVGLACLYWLVFLRCLPPRRVRQVVPPVGMTAGEMGSALTGNGAELTMMVLSWAQLGYVLIYLDDNGRIILHKRMDMGNERSDFEVRCFRALFGKREMVDATKRSYAELCDKVASLPQPRAWFRQSSGNPVLLRILAAGIMLFGAMTIGFSLAGDAALLGLLIFLICAFGAVSAWHIQSGAYCLFRHDKLQLWIGMVFCVIWLALGIVSGKFTLAYGIVAAQWLFGLAAAYSGKRTEIGRQTMAQVLGLRRYLRTVSTSELKDICREDPEYFFALAPYALALGVDRKFAKQFGSGRLPGCPYLTTGMDAHMTAGEWAAKIARTANEMNAIYRMLPYERFLSGLAALSAVPARKRKKKQKKRGRRR